MVMKFVETRTYAFGSSPYIARRRGVGIWVSDAQKVTPHTCVIPVKTGIQTLLLFPKRIWIPVFTGMTKEKKNKGEDRRCEGLPQKLLTLLFLYANIALSKSFSLSLRRRSHG